MAKAPSASDNALAVIPEASEIQKKFRKLVKQAGEIAIASQADYERVVGLGRGVKSLLDECDATFDETIASANKTHKLACAAKSKWAGPLKKLEKLIKAAIAQYTLQRQDEARIEQAQANRALECDGADRRNALADALDSADEGAAAEIVRGGALTGKPHFVEALPEVAGVSAREVWLPEIVNAADIPREWLMPDMDKLKDYASMMKAQASIPGVRFYKDAVVSLRSAT